MTDIQMNSDTNVPDINEALSQVMPELRRSNVLGWAMIAGLVLIAGVSLINLWDDAGNLRQWVMFLLIAAVVFIPSVFRWVQRRHEAEIMPLLASAAGLSYQQGGKFFVDSLPPVFFPKQAAAVARICCRGASVIARSALARSRSRRVVKTPVPCSRGW